MLVLAQLVCFGRAVHYLYANIAYLVAVNGYAPLYSTYEIDIFLLY